MQPNKEKRDKTIARRQKEEQERLLENFRKMPILQVSLDKAGIGRSTYYEWRENDEQFRNAADAAIRDERLVINAIEEFSDIAFQDEAVTSSVSAHFPSHFFKSRDAPVGSEVNTAGE